LNQKGDTAAAVRTLNAIIKKYPGYSDAQMLLRKVSSGKRIDGERRGSNSTLT